MKEWIQNLGLGDHIPFVHDEDEADDEPMHMQHDESSSVKNRYLVITTNIISLMLGSRQYIKIMSLSSFQKRPFKCCTANDQTGTWEAAFRFREG